MFKTLLSVCSIVVLLLPTLLLPARATACPVKMPETLLSLYRNSDAIYVARFAKVDDHEILENTDDRTVVNIRKHFDVSSTLKGEPQKLVVLDERDYRYKPSPADAEAEAETAEGEESGADAEEPAAGDVEDEDEDEEEEDEDDRYSRPTLEPGDLILLFVKKDEETGSIELTDYRDAIRKMTPEKLESYEARIRDLNAIFSAKKVDDASIVEWLVRCAQDPFTRWEGAFELRQSFQELEWLANREPEDDADAPDDGEKADDEETAAASDAAGEAEIDRSVYARLLSDTQKQTLMNILMEPRQAAEPTKETRLSTGDRVLIELVSDWGDMRFARFLLDRMQASAGDPSFVDDLMTSVVRILDDDDLRKIASIYSDVYYEDGDAPVEDQASTTEASTEAEDADDNDAGAADESTTDAKPAAVSPVIINATEPAASAEAEVPVKKLTYNELRADLLARFIDRGLVAVQIAESMPTERAKR
jgi:hypothetical protein